VKSPILSGAYTARSVNAADNRLINLYPEAVKEGGYDLGFLTRCPGLRKLATIGSGPIRGLWKMGPVPWVYVVSGQGLYEVNPATWTGILRGNVSAFGGLAQMSDNGTQLFISEATVGYIYNIGTTAFGAITDPDFTSSEFVGYLDGYFVYNEGGGQKFWVTSLLDGTSINPLEFASAEASPDILRALLVDHREVWLFGDNSTEVWYNAGLTDFPLARVQGVFLEIGVDAPNSVAKLDNSIFWLGGDERGRGIVYRANGYNAVRVSTHAIETAIASYMVKNDAMAFTYSQEGHQFYVLTFRTEGKTWVFDVATGEWHERAAFAGGVFTRYRAQCHVAVAGLNVVGDYVTGDIYALDLAYYGNEAQKWLRSWRALPPGQNDGKRTVHKALQLHCESGVGTNSGQGSNPIIYLRWSDDGGHTWSNSLSRPMGQGLIGEYGKRILWRRLGTTQKLRDRIYEVSGSDPVKITIISADLELGATSE